MVNAKAPSVAISMVGASLRLGGIVAKVNKAKQRARWARGEQRLYADPSRVTHRNRQRRKRAMLWRIYRAPLPRVSTYERLPLQPWEER